MSQRTPKPPAADTPPEQPPATDDTPNPALAVVPEPEKPTEREYEVTGEHHIIVDPDGGEHLHRERFKATYPLHIEAHLIGAGHIKRVEANASRTNQEG